MSLKNRIKNITASSKEQVPVKVSQADSEEGSHGIAVQPLHFELLTSTEQEYKDNIHGKLLEILDLSLIVKMEEADARKQINEITRHLIEDDESLPVNAKIRQLIINEVANDILGLGPLEHLLYNVTISDILVNGYDSIYVERFGKLEKTPIAFKDNTHLLRVIDKIVTSVGRRIDESSPLVDARLKDGSRVNAIIPPLAMDGPSMSIRRFNQDKMKLDEYLNFNSLNLAMAEVLKKLIPIRLNVLISGGTGSGKTTLLNALSNHISEKERLVTIEDSAELQLQQEHVVRLETRPSNIEGKGEVTQRDLLKNALRMRPDRIIIGEVRGEEAFDMLQAMNTGHDGSLTTIHANSPRDALSRVENMVTMAGFELPARTIRAQITSALNVVIQLERLEDGTRKITSVSEINGMEGDIITMSEIFRFERQGLDDKGNVIGEFQSTGIVPRFHERMKQRGLDLNLDVYLAQTK